MCDWAMERTLPLGSFNVDMNPLMIAGAGRKRVDSWLVYGRPIGNTELLPDSITQTRKGEIAHVLLLDH